jgi:hypothetical protein
MSGHRDRVSVDDGATAAAGGTDLSAYPYGSRPLVPAWGDGKSRVLAACAILAATAATAARWPLALAGVDDWALRILFPALLAFVLAFAPPPRTRVSRIARDLTVAGLAAAVFAGPFIPVMIACFPVVLAIAVIAGEIGRKP